jgi:Na+-driven multidrug efflux pump
MKTEFRNKVLKLALPIAAQQFMLALVSACDAFMLGGLNQNSLSAVSLASQITFVFNLILTALTIGENMFVAQYYGKKDFDGLRTSAGLVLRYVVAVSVLFLIATLFVPETLMRLFTNDTNLIDYGVKYLKLIGLSYVFSGILQVLQGVLKNCGYVGKCTVISTIVVCVNIILNAVLIYFYDYRWYFSGGRRYEIWLKVRHGYYVVLCSSAGMYRSIRTEVAGADGLFCFKP